MQYKTLSEFHTASDERAGPGNEATWFQNVRSAAGRPGRIFALST